jgi:WhiB family redox-sensing transcriptional regulator
VGRSPKEGTTSTVCGAQGQAWQGSTRSAQSGRIVWGGDRCRNPLAALRRPGDQSDPSEWLAQLTRRPEWHADAACRGAGTDGFIIGRGANAAIMARARAICSTCLVAAECLDYALGDVDAVGIWGATTAQQRRVMRTGRVA